MAMKEFLEVQHSLRNVQGEKGPINVIRRNLEQAQGVDNERPVMRLEEDLHTLINVSELRENPPLGHVKMVFDGKEGTVEKGCSTR